MRRWTLLLAFAGLLAAPLQAQEMDVAPIPLRSAPRTFVFADPPDTNVEPYYAAHPGTLVWLRNADTRAAAAELVALLRNAQVDGFTDGPMLVAGVQAAIKRGLPADDGVISNAWVRYVQALKRPVEGVSFGDPALQLRPPSPGAILSAASRASSLQRLVERIANVNPLYASLRDAAVARGDQNELHVRATLERLRPIPARGKAILVDAANAQLTMLEDGRPVGGMKVIVGKPDTATPLIASTIHYVTLNPVWHLPPDFARNKVAPLVLKHGVGILEAARYETVAGFGWGEERPVDPASIDWKAVAAGRIEAHIRQRAGPRNSMGLMKFGFDNDYGIFLHDTPHKELFAQAKRDLSLGCVRLENPQGLAEWLLGREPEAKDGGSEQNVPVARGVPVFITYLTARADDGAIAFAKDVYGLDRQGGEALAAAN